VSQRASEAPLARVAVLGGGGAVGRLMAAALADAGSEVVVVDRAAEPTAEGRPPQLAAEDRAAPRPARDRPPKPASPPAGRWRAIQLDVERDAAELAGVVADVDAIVLALPEAVALAALPQVLSALAPGALLADTLSVKTPFVQAVRAIGASVEALSLNPMFAPALGFGGRAVLAVEVSRGRRSDALIALLEARGARVVRVDEERHDALAAALQVLPHAALLSVGLALARLDVELDELLAVAPPPFVALVALLARIASASPETYWDIQDANPRAVDARAALAAGLADLDAVARAHDPGGFDTLLERIDALLGDDREPLAQLAAALVEQARPATPS
jgi:4-amino-4-deoxyprephenate dehydrogenase